MKLKEGALVLVADGSKYLVFRNHGDGGGFLDLQVMDIQETENPKSSDHVTDRAGRRSGHGAGKSALEEKDWHKLSKVVFAKDLAVQLDRMAIERKFEQLVLAADPRTLGALRSEIGEPVKTRIVGELNRDLTNMQVSDIEKAIEALAPLGS